MHADILIFDLTHFDCFNLTSLCVPCTGVPVRWLLAVHEEHDQQILALIVVCDCLSGKVRNITTTEIGILRML